MNRYIHTYKYYQNPLDNSMEKCLNKDIQVQKILLIIGVIVGLYEYYDIVSMVKEVNGVGVDVSFITFIMISGVIGLITTSIKKIYNTLKEGYSLVLGEVSDVQTIQQGDNKSNIVYKHTIIVDHLRLTASSERFITKNFKHIYIKKIFDNNVRQIFPLHTVRLYFFDMKTREVIFDLTDFIRL